MAKTEATIITLTLQPGSGSQRQGSLLIQRGDLANLSQFTFSRMSEITEAITQAANALAALEIDPPDMTVKTTSSRQKKGKSSEKKTERKINLDDPPDNDEEAPSEPEPEAAEVEDDPDDLANLL